MASWALLALVATFAPHTAHALVACTADDIIAADPACPPSSAPCTISLNFEIGADCTLDFAPRAVVIAGQLITPGTVAINAGTLAIAPTGSLRADPGLCPTDFCDEPGFTLNAGGDIWIQRLNRYTYGRIEIVGDLDPGEIIVETPGTFRLDGEIHGDTDVPGGSGASIWIDASAGVVLSADSRVSANGGPKDEDGYLGLAGSLLIVSDGSAALDGDVALLGEGVASEYYSMAVEVGASVHIGGSIHLDGYRADAGAGGLQVVAGSEIDASGEISAVPGPATLGDEGGGGSGEVQLRTRGGNLDVAGTIQVDGVLHGHAGRIDLCASCDDELFVERGGKLSVGGRLSARQNRLHDAGDYGPGRVWLGGDEVAFTGVIDIQNESELEIRARGSVHLGGEVNARVSLLDRNWSGYGSRLSIISRGYDIESDDEPGNLVIDGSLDLTTTGCDAGECAVPHELEIEGCNVEVAGDAWIDMRGPYGGKLSIDATHLSVDGGIDVRGTKTHGAVSLHAPLSNPYPVCPPTLEHACNVTTTPQPGVLRFGECAASSSACLGDCDGDGTVEPEEIQTILTLINLCGGDGYGTACPVVQPSCLAADPDGDYISARDLQRALDCAAQHP